MLKSSKYLPCLRWKKLRALFTLKTFGKFHKCIKQAEMQINSAYGKLWVAIKTCHLKNDIHLS